MMKTNERFIEALQYMDETLRADNKAGHQWKYCNVSRKKAQGFEKARKQGKYLMNCCDGVQWGLRIASSKIPISWYGSSDGTIVFIGSQTKTAVKKYFKIISTGGKTVNQLYKAGSLCDGDILLGYQGFGHTNVYYGGGKSFDSGHAYASPKSGEGAKIKKLIGSLSHKTAKVNWILRLKDRAHYRVQAGAYTDLSEYTKNKEKIEKKGFPVSMVKEDSMFKIQLGYFSGKTNAERFAAKVAKKGISVFVREIL